MKIASLSTLRTTRISFAVLEGLAVLSLFLISFMDLFSVGGINYQPFYFISGLAISAIAFLERVSFIAVASAAGLGDTITPKFKFQTTFFAASVIGFIYLLVAGGGVR